jgi:hypothetical protein
MRASTPEWTKDQVKPPRHWAEAVEQLLAAVDPQQRAAVQQFLKDWHAGGRGLREWARSLLRRGKAVPEALPRELVQVYLDDPDAEPLHDCARCGVAVPVHPAPRGAGGAEFAYFRLCPVCGGRTGLYAYWATSPAARAAEALPAE